METEEEEKRMIADILLHFEDLHSAVILFISIIIHDVDLTAIIFNDMRFSQLIIYFKKIIQYKNVKMKPEELKQLLEDLRTASEYRNEVAHAELMSLVSDIDELDTSIEFVWGKGKVLIKEILKDYDDFILKTTKKVREEVNNLTKLPG